MKKITVWNRKGGVGKTTICINLAYELYKKGKKVLCLDLDGQANLTSFFEADIKGVSKPDLARILDANSNPDIRGSISFKVRGNPNKLTGHR